MTLGFVVACDPGPRKPGPHPGEQVFWRITSSDVAFGQCTDHPEFIAELAPIPFDENTYFAYRVSKDGKTAVVLDCATRSPASCKDNDLGVEFQVSGHELFFSADHATAIDQTQCSLTASESWTLEDRGTTLDMRLGNVFGLQGDEADCAAVDASVAKASPNSLGIQGCVVTFILTGEYSER